MKELTFRTPTTAQPWVRATGYAAAQEIMDREGAQQLAASRSAGQQQRRVERERQSKELRREAGEWVQRVGFELRLQSFAIPVAMDLRSQLGPGAVTKTAVMARMRLRWPWLFGESIDQA